MCGAATNITIVDYGLGNVLSLRRACEKFGASVSVTSDPDTILSADGLVLPGVGAFGKAMSLLKEKRLDSVITQYMQTQKPLIGICLGMQILFEIGHEFGRHDGLGFIKGEVEPLLREKDVSSPKTPNVGWFEIDKNHHTDEENNLLSTTQSKDKFYFVHSYACVPEDTDFITSTANFGDRKFVASIQNKNLYGFQFHPEKSGAVGLRIIENFVTLCREWE